ncbi:MAG: chemotaxis protein CheB [Parvibaculum sp.]|uniref:chemotaxis protein CheB n=1 Tax=Parvibaculum sp. TaxID=2024848 RepID=UPI002ABC2409|nr:chemotaxis protein CheB [Parvibaculum sp.]MDZ4381736.1 chemotaxis protein CheB [Parvibaculum sp.]
MDMPGSRSPRAGAAGPRLGGRAPPSDDLLREPDNFPVVGIGASAGGLDACKRLVSALPANIGMAFILVQHLDPTHESMMVDLLAEHTTMSVRQATDGMPIERDYLYLIPPGTYLSIKKGALHLSQPAARHGARLPFDFLLHSLTEQYGPRAVCVVLSGTGADGSLGLRHVKQNGGLVIAQDPDEAAYDGMPKSAIMTGAVDLVLPVTEIPGALIEHAQRMALIHQEPDSEPTADAQDRLSEIIDLLRARTTHNFTLYKRGTLQRRIERRMALAAVETDDMNRYLEVLQNDESELDLLAKDLLINVTSFFRDPTVFDFLAEKIVPGMILGRSLDQPLRVWIAGCSTGEEVYSLAMLFQEQITAARQNIKLQIFASDVDEDAVASAREGRYPEAIEADVSAARLARFFTKEGHNYRILPALRETIIFTVQDVLTDPPFSRLDMISCRNLLIYLRPEAQARAISVFHFALHEGGILLLGGSETIGVDDGRFEIISKQQRLYRQVGRSSPGEFGHSIGVGDTVRYATRTGPNYAPPRQTMLAELCRKLVMDTYAPAAVLINLKHECLYSIGPTDRYLRVAPGQPTHDLLAMAPQDMRTKLRSAIQKAGLENVRVSVAGGTTRDGARRSFGIEVQPVINGDEELMLVCFVDGPESEPRIDAEVRIEDISRVVELEQELESTRTELQGAIHDLEMSNEEQKALNEEAVSINEEYQSTNEELLTSKEELQSLNEELTALNSQLQETLERQRTTSNDLQNVLYSTDVATIFLDTHLSIRFFTPATRALFSIIPGDIGRPLTDIASLAVDDALPADARSVLNDFIPIEREIEAKDGVWFIRRILPYRTHDNRVEGVVITFTDITDQKRTSRALEAARQQADLANVAKSRFLAAASHDLRQPLQTLALLQGLLTKMVNGEDEKKLVVRLEATLAAMSGMLNTLLDLNQIEAGTVHAEMADIKIDDILGRMKDEFAYTAQAQDLSFRVVPCDLSIRSDSHLLEQMIRNMLSNAFKYTRSGRVLLGCRRRGGMLSIEILDSGMGIPRDELEAIFDEYHQIDNTARERSRGLGLGLSIVRHLGKLLDHPVRVRSQPGKGSCFSIEVPLVPAGEKPSAELPWRGLAGRVRSDVRQTGTILIVEDDSEVRELLEILLSNEGHRVVAAADGAAALRIVTREEIRPDIILADYNLPNGMNGLKLVAKLREKFGGSLPSIILTGDISAGVLRDIAARNCLQLNKPVKSKELTEAIQRLLLAASLPETAMRRAGDATPLKMADSPVVFIVDDDSQIRAAIRELLEADGFAIEEYADSEAFVESYRPGGEACLLIDAVLPGMDGFGLLQHLNDSGHCLPAVMITGNGDVSMAVRAMKAGAVDFIEKPIGHDELRAAVLRAIEQARDRTKVPAWQEEAAMSIARLTRRQRQIMELVLAGQPSKNIASDLGISQRTVESHRAAIMKKTGVKSLPALVRLALAATNSAGKPGSDK